MQQGAAAAMLSTSRQPARPSRCRCYSRRSSEARWWALQRRLEARMCEAGDLLLHPVGWLVQLS